MSQQNLPGMGGVVLYGAPPPVVDPFEPAPYPPPPPLVFPQVTPSPVQFLQMDPEKVVEGVLRGIEGMVERRVAAVVERVTERAVVGLNNQLKNIHERLAAVSLALDGLEAALVEDKPKKKPAKPKKPKKGKKSTEWRPQKHKKTA